MKSLAESVRTQLDPTPGRGGLWLFEPGRTLDAESAVVELRVAGEPVEVSVVVDGDGTPRSVADGEFFRYAVTGLEWQAA